MSSGRMTALAAAALLAAAPMTIAPAWAGGDFPASAYGISASFISGGAGTRLPPVAPVSGDAAPYSHTARVPTFSDVLPIVPDTTPTPALSVDATALVSHVASNGIQLDSASSSARAKLGSLTLSLNLYPPPPTATTTPVPEPFLTVTADKVEATANFSEVFPDTTTVTGSTTIGDLTISGSLVNNQVLHFSGRTDKGKVLFQSSRVTITVGQQIKAGLISCDPQCHFWPVDLTTEAIDIALQNADLDGRTVSGDIVIGNAHVASAAARAAPAGNQ